MKMRNSTLLKLLCLVCLFCSSAHGQEVSFPFLDIETIGAKAFRNAHPDWDGRGVAIAILDTGVDMGVEGLRVTSEGKVKVVEARDFTGEAVVECHVPSVEKKDGRLVWRVNSYWILGLERHGLLDANVYIGFLEETKITNPNIRDLNNNRRMDDRFGVVVFQDKDSIWKAIVDQRGDGDVSDDPVIPSYSIGHKHISFLGDDPTSPLISVAIHIVAEKDGPKKVEFHIPSGSHGTHVAGIAGGYKIAGQDGFDGVAPGSVILSLKIGNNRLAGGATVTESMKRAIEFAGRWATQHGMPVVINISYGISSEIEGFHAIDTFIEKFVEENPHVVIVTSAGNSGPGLSTIGSPSGSLFALSVGAGYSEATGRDVFGATTRGFKLFHFSSRGGELAKPDLVAPGIASSTVPYWERQDVMRGTSMASPQIAGAVALVLSAIRDARWNSGMVMRAFRASSIPINQYTRLDVGGGLCSVERAYKTLKEIINDTGAQRLIDIEIKTLVPNQPQGFGRSPYFRTLGFAPEEKQPHKVTIRPRFIASATDKEKAEFFRTFDLTTDQSWLHIPNKRLAIRGNKEVDFYLWVDKTKINKPGVYVATVSGVSKSLRFDFPVTVIKPHRPEILDGIPKIRLRDIRISPGDITRIPFAPIPGTGNMNLKIKWQEGKNAQVYAYLYDQQGRKIALDNAKVWSLENVFVDETFSVGGNLEFGTYELVLYAVPTAKIVSYVDVEITFYQMQADQVETLSLRPGGLPESQIKVVNMMETPFVGKALGEISGYQKTYNKTVALDMVEDNFYMSHEIKEVEIILEMSEKDYALFTDISVEVFDHKGSLVVQSAFNTRVIRLRVPNTSGGDNSYRLIIRGGMALGNKTQVTIETTIRFIWKEMVLLEGEVFGDKRFVLYPGVATRVKIQGRKTPKAIPESTVYYGNVKFINESDGSTWLVVPVRTKVAK